jgi:type IV secretory pathway VirB10-like protein
MIPRKIGELADRRGVNKDRGFYTMATSKSTGESKDKAAPKKKAAPKATAAKKATPKKPAAKTVKKVTPKATVKKAPPKKASGPKLTPPQITMLEAIAKVTGPKGFVAAKRPDQKTVDALLKHKLVKKGRKDDKTKNFFVLISLAGKKFLGTKSAPVAKA